MNKDLTVRELAVLECIKAGKNTADTAHTLAVRECTVKFHIRNIMRKLGAVNRTHAVAIAMAAGLIPAQRVRLRTRDAENRHPDFN